MQRVSQLIKSELGRFPDCEYYLAIISKAESNVSRHPDICIETCKSLLEGISKTVLARTQKNLTTHHIENLKFVPVVTKAMHDLRDNDDVIEDDFKSKVVDMARALGTLRNHRSDISHGRSVPKTKQSTESLALLCLHTTEAIAFYMLEAYFALPVEFTVPEDSETADAEAELPGGIPQIDYDANPDFNDQLDILYRLDGKMLYSDALYRLYYEDYIIELEAFLDTLNDAENGDAGGDDGNTE